MKRLFILLGMSFSVATVFSQNITKAEYFIDTDPGQGKGTPVINFAPGDIVNFSFDIPTTTLSDGFHFLATRVYDAEGKWSRYETRGFYLSSTTSINTSNIVAAESFVDIDPGPGKGTPASVGNSGSTVTFTVVTPPQLAQGFHFLSIRVKDADGKWGWFEQRGFYVIPTPSNTPPIVAVEYFYDTDPGVGKGSSLTVSSPGDSIKQTFSIPVPNSLSLGKHFLGIRVKDGAGNWSLFKKDSINLGASTGSITCPGNITIDPFTNDCKAVVNHIDAVGLPENDSSYTYTLTGATTGNGIGTASGQVFNAGITTVTYALINSPTVSCSFSVTVKSSVTPTAAISIGSTTICSGALATFVCVYTGGGFNTSWQWKKNGIPVGTNSNIYRDSTLKNNDTITVAVTSSVSCANPQMVTSAPVVMTVYETVTPSVSINATATAICPGQLVTFTAVPTHGGNPIYYWTKNGSVVGSDSVYQTSSLANGDSVYVTMYNTADCVTITPVQSNVIHITTSQAVAPSVTITSSTTTICAGTQVTFTATAANGGNSPNYQWQLNGNNIPGATGSTYHSSSLVNGDKIKLVMTSSLACASQLPVISNEIIMSVNTEAPASVVIVASQTTICLAQQVTFTATPTNGGSNPVYEWTVNNNAVNTVNSNIYQSTTLHDGDVVRVTMSPSQGCGNNTPVYSNSITMRVNSTVAPSVIINASSIDICSGQQVTFTANPTNSGDNPSYQWKLNGVNVGGDSAVFNTSTLANADTVKVVMTSSIGCASPQMVTSNKISMDVSPSVAPSVSITSSATAICSGTQVTFTATSSNGGNAGYEWRLNGNKVGTNSDTYQSSTLSNGDSIVVYMTSFLPCANPKTVKSNVVVMSINNAQTFYRDLDGDGYGSSASGTIQACTAPAGYIATNNDCNDNNANIHPLASDICGNGTDENCNGTADENCATENLPHLLVRTYPVKEGNVVQTVLSATVTLDKPALTAATVRYETIDEDAKAGSDYLAVNGWLTFPVGATSATMQFRIVGDMFKEGNERFAIRFSQPSGILLNSDSLSRVMIIDDDHNVKKLQMLTVPNRARRNQVWHIPGIENFENVVLIMDANGQLIKRFTNYRNHSSVGNIALGIYFYRITLKESNGELKTYSGRLLVSE